MIGDNSSLLDLSLNAIPGIGGKVKCSEGNFCIARFAWEPAGGATLPRTKLCVVPLRDGKLAVVGGKLAEGERVEHCEAFIRSKGFAKEERIILPKSRSGFGCVALEGDIYVVGGSDGRALHKFERWIADDKRWEVLERMGTKRDELAAAAGGDGKIYVAGGCGGTDRACLASCERFDPATQLWENIAPMKEGRRALSLVAHGRFVYAVGGFDGKNYLRSVERFDITLGRWESVRSMKRERCSQVAVVKGERIIVMGGFDGEPLRESEEYDVAKDEWKMCKSVI